jgi:DNA-binding Xre family transcriptional regulator
VSSTREASGDDSEGRLPVRRVMAGHGMFATTELVPRLPERGIRLSREQVYRLVTGVPERLNLTVLAAPCDILHCSVADLIEPVTKAGPVAAAPANPPPEQIRPRRARVAPARPEQ